MSLTKASKIIISIASIVVVTTAVAVPTSIIMNIKDKTITLNLIYNAGVMIEAKGYRIYIDPIELTDNYNDLPADVILITHAHQDHFQISSMTMLQQSDTIIVFPATMTTHIALYNGTGIAPGDSFLVGPINITAFYMYTFAEELFPSTHPQEYNWTSYIIDIDGFTIFHAGDSDNIPEYTQLKGLIDVAMLPLGPGCQTMTGIEVVNAIDVIEPSYFIPIHYREGTDEEFIENYGTDVENCGCEIIHLSYFESYKFKL